MCSDLRLVVQVRLMPTCGQAAALEATLRAVNEAANHVSRVAFTTGTRREYALRRHTYRELKTRGLGAQAAQHVIKKVADAYTALHANIRNGNLGPQGSPRRARATSKPITFRADAAQPFDDRCLSWQIDARTVSIWTTAGRVRDVAFTASAEQLTALAAYRKGGSDLVCRDGMWFLIATCDVPDRPIAVPDAFVGVDLGIANIATTSDGDRHSGKGLNAHRHRQRRLRRRLQAKATKSAKRLLKRRRRKEARFAANINHIIAKQIVTEAERTGRGIALEDLGGIRDRVRLRKPQRVTLHSWSFHQLGSFIAYKAARSGVAVIHVDPAYTSQTCSSCGHVDKRNRPDQETFACTSCGFAEHADVNAARNIAARGVAGWAVSHAADAA
ncbi:IS200/IS605 family element transposase accessory protein TnpB [Microbispora sp. NEAU-D428]|uniref:RNA-guided endonuclease InsQ/TnpB family protein n=1 Tax=Microbispora sitophila TaxID=2771537 RepID=UPI00186851F4|nr:RNA-guided endonuclease TnpB family protein [Microbispora sitophila]MBE3008493.1 IS200/IS605 family element transposase accessory protein TnpB [Microbispora sitophila]